MALQPVQIFTAGTAVVCRASFTLRPLTDYEAGQFQLSGALPAGVAVDPASVSCTVRRPDGSDVAAPVVRDGAGSYHATVDTTGIKGQWHVHIASPAGDIHQGAGEAKFITELDV